MIKMLRLAIGGLLLLGAMTPLTSKAQSPVHFDYRAEKIGDKNLRHPYYR